MTRASGKRSAKDRDIGGPSRQGLRTPLGSDLTRQDRRRACALAVLAFVVYNANLRAVSSGDCFPARFLPFSILKTGSVNLEPLVDAVRQGHKDPYWLQKSIGGHWVSLFPIVAPVLVTPLYVPAAIAVQRAGWRRSYLDAVAELMEKISGSAIASLSVAFVYLLVRRRLSPGRAVLLTAAYAFGTSTWVTGSQALWQHGQAELLVAGALLLVTREPTGMRAFAIGAACALGAMNRPPDIVLFAPIALEAVLRTSWKGPLLRAGVAGAVIAAAPFLAYNIAAFGLPGGGYQVLYLHASGRDAIVLRASLFPALSGMLFSPAKGLFFFSPFLLFLAGRLKKDAQEGLADRRLSLLLGAGVVTQILLYTRTEWRGGYSFGPRYLVDLLPILVFLLAPVVAALGRRGLVAFALSAALGAGFQAVGAFCYPKGLSDLVVYCDGPGSPKMDVWSLSRSPVVLEAQAGMAPMTFAAYARDALR